MSSKEELKCDRCGSTGRVWVEETTKEKLCQKCFIKEIENEGD